MKIQQQYLQLVQELCNYITENVDGPISLSALAKRAGYSEAHFQKIFKSVVGSSPKQYQEELKNKMLKKELKAAYNVSDAIYAAGFGSTSRVYEKLNHTLGMTPKQYRQGAEGMDISYAIAKTNVGLMMVAATHRGICFLQFGENESTMLATLKTEFPSATIIKMQKSNKPMFDAWIKSLNHYLAGQQPLQQLPLDIRGTAFQMLVWRYLQTIPAGEVRSYKEVAEAIGKPKAIRAVATACASNQVSLVIPCHRVIRGDGNLAGYRWGLEIKKSLIALEKKALR